MKPSITLRAPRKEGKDWVLEAEIRPLGIRVAAFVSPESVAWLEAQLRRGTTWLGRLVEVARRQLGIRIGFAGDWKSFGVLGQLATSIAYGLASDPQLDLAAHMVDGAKLYLSYQGERGPLARQNALVLVERIEVDAAQGVEMAVEAKTILTLVAAADQILHNPDAYQILAELEGQREDPQAVHLLAAVQALGTVAGRSGDVVVSYDAESFLGEPEQCRAMFGYASSERTLRAIRPTLSPLEAVQRMGRILAAYEASRNPSFGAENPDEYDMRHGPTWGYGV